MQQDALVGVRDVKGVADLGRGPAEHVTHGDDFPLAWRESIDGPADRFERLGIECALFGISPRMWWPFPLSSPAAAETSKPSRIDGGLVVERRGRREWDRATLLYTT